MRWEDFLRSRTQTTSFPSNSASAHGSPAVPTASRIRPGPASRRPNPPPPHHSPAAVGGVARRAAGALQLQVGGAAGTRRGAENWREAEAEAVHQTPQHAVPAALGRCQPHVVAQLLWRHLQVARVPEHPPDEAEEDADAARVD